MDNILNNIYGVLLNPLETFDRLKNEGTHKVFEAFIIVLIVSVIGALQSSHEVTFLVMGLNIFLFIIIAIISWIFVGSVIDGLSSLFTHTSKLDTLLVLTAYSLIPWVLIAPIDLFKGAGILFTIIGILLSFMIWIWSTVLFIIALAKTYELGFGGLIILLLMPFLGGLIALSWISGFIYNLFDIIIV